MIKALLTLVNEKQIGGQLIMAHFETNTKEGMDNVMLVKENNDIGLVQENIGGGGH